MRICGPYRSPVWGSEASFQAPRSARRGAALLGAGLAAMLWVIVLNMVAGQIVQQLRVERANGLAAGLASLAADYDFYVHEQSTTLGALLAAADEEALLLPNIERDAFLATGWRHSLAALPSVADPFSTSLPGLDIALGVAQSDLGEQPVGVIVVSAHEDVAPSFIRDVNEALERRSSNYATVVLADTDEVGELLLGSELTRDQLAFATAGYSELNPKLVLREARAGHEALRSMTTDLSFIDNSAGAGLVGAGLITADQVDLSGCSVSSGDCATAASITVAAPVIDALADTVTIEGTLFTTVAATMAQAIVDGGIVSSEWDVDGQVVSRDELTVNSGARIGTLESTAITAEDVITDGVAASSGVAITGSGYARIIRTDLLDTARADIGSGATVSPAIESNSLLSQSATFGSINVSRCSGC